MRGALPWTAAALLLLVAGCGGTKESAPKTEDAGARTEDAGAREAPAKRDGPEVVGETMILVVDPPAGLAKMKPEELVSLEGRQREAQALDLELYAARGEENPRIKGMIEQILLNDAGIPSSIRRKLEDYARLMWLNKGVEDLRTGDRLRPRFIPGELAAAANIALANGAAIDMPKAAGTSLEANRIEELEGLLAIVRPEIFEAHARDTGRGTRGGPVDEGWRGRGRAATYQPGTRGRGDPPGRQARSHALKALGRLGRAHPQRAQGGRGEEHRAGGAGETDPRIGGPRGRRDRGRPAAHRERASVARSDGGVRGAGPLPLERRQGLRRGGRGSPHGRRPGRPEGARGHEQRAVAGPPRDLLLHRGWGARNGTGKKPRDWMSDRLGEHFRVVSELRRELAAVYLLRDESVRRAGFFEEGEAPEALCEAYVRHAAITWILGEQSAPLPAARAAILGHLAAAGAVSVTLGDDGRAAVTLEDKAAFERAIERQLAEIRRIRFVGDRAGAGRFLDEGRVGLAQRVLRAAKKSARALELPRYVAFIYLSLGKDGAPVSKPGSFAEHQLRLASTGRRVDPYGELGGARPR